MIIIFSISCHFNKSQSEVIDKWEMVPIVYDLINVDEHENMLKVLDSMINEEARFIKYEQVFKLHNTDLKNFKNSYNYYLSRPDLLNLIYDSVQRVAAKNRGYEKMTIDSLLPLKNKLPIGK